MSSNDIAVAVRGLSKSYTIAHNTAKHTMLGEALAHRLKNPFQRPETETFWALKDIDFDIKKGDVVGIIGRNGAGKSTLLKILSQITEPTRGEVRLYGRVGSLLEVGTGFHPELTGRENIYLNGAILGMRRSEIDRQFDAIVDFAEVEQFLDTPVKRYSSGMYVRLAFAVAAHLNPDILIVDEVLAVGDAEFQKKCLGKMEDVAQSGRTVLFVSHNMAAVKSLCSRAILMISGCVVCEGTSHEVVDRYNIVSSRGTQTSVIPKEAHRTGSTGEAKFESIKLTDLADNTVEALHLGQPFRIKLSIETSINIREVAIEVGVVSSEGTHITCSSTLDGGLPPFVLEKGRHEISLDICAFLLPHQYSVMLIIHHFNGHIIDWVESASEFSVQNMALNGNDFYRYFPTIRGYIRPQTSWNLSTMPSTSSLRTEEGK